MSCIQELKVKVKVDLELTPESKIILQKLEKLGAILEKNNIVIDVATDVDIEKILQESTI